MKRVAWILTAVTISVAGWVAQSGMVAAADHGICERIGEMADAGTIKYHWQDKIDINNDGVLETIQFVGDHVYDSAVYHSEDGATLPVGDAGGEPSDGLFWQHLVMGDNTYRVQCRDPGCWAPSRVILTSPSNATTEVCRFRQQYQEVVRTGPPFCQSLIGDNTSKYISGNPIRSEDSYRQKKFLYPRARVNVDFNNDGSKDELIRMDIVNESRVPCAYSYFDLLNTEHASEGFEKRRKVLLELQQIADPEEESYPTNNCYGNDAGWLFFDGKVLFETKYRGQSPDVRSQFHDVIKMNQDGTMDQICQYTVLQKTQVVR
ncbi:MAG: hypothetical protein ACOY3E_13925 [Pseudomonadota bacterium]